MRSMQTNISRRISLIQILDDVSVQTSADKRGYRQLRFSIDDKSAVDSPTMLWSQSHIEPTLQEC